VTGRLIAWLRRPLAERTLAEFVAHRLRFALATLLVLFVASTVGYVAIEHQYGWLDAAYMTVITLSTVGYGEVRPLDTAGRVFTVLVIVAAFATFVYAAATLTNLFTSGEAVEQLRASRGKRMREALNNHVIVVGFGRVGQAVARGVRELDRPCLVIDRDPAREQAIHDAGHVPFIGDATSEDDLREAGVERADALVAAAEQDDINLIVTLTARAMRPHLRIVSRVNEASWEKRIRAAGASVAQSPYLSYGMSLAASAVSPAVLDVHDLPLLGLGTEEVEIEPTSHLIGMGLDGVSAVHNVMVIGLRRNRRLHRWDEVDGPIVPGDILVALGTPERLRQLGGAV
jgi:voltage-gated potassium channel